MAKKILLDVLESTIGRYVEHLDPNQLNLAIWNGQIDLYNVNVNAAAINYEIQDLPISILQGSVETLQVVIPWTHLTSKSVQIKIHGVKLTAQPKHVKVSEKSIEELEKKRIEEMDQAEQFRKTVQKLSQANDSSDHDSFAARLMRRIIENIHIEVHDVHVALQHDSLSTIGLCWEKFTVCTTNQDGVPTFVDRTAENDSHALYKQIQLKKFAIYMDQKPKQKNHEYIVEPLTFTGGICQLDEGYWKKQDTKKPRYHISSTISTVSIGVSKHQVVTLPGVIESLVVEQPAVPILFPEYRPNKTVKQDAKLWWKYGYRCVGRLTGKTSWREFFHAFKRRKLYIQLYQRQTVHQDSTLTIKREPLSESEKEELKAMDHDPTISVDAIMKWRSLAEAELNQEQQKLQEQEKKKAKTGGFLWWGGGNKGDDANDSEALPIKLSVEELQKLESFSLASDDDNNEALAELSLLSVQYVLESFQVKVIADAKENINLLQMDMGLVHIDFDSLMNGAFSFNYTLSSMSARDLVTTNTLYPRILSAAVDNDKALFEVQMKKTKSGDQSLDIRLQPIQVVASPQLVQALMKFTKKEKIEESKDTGESKDTDKSGVKSKELLEKVTGVTEEEAADIVSSKVTEFSNLFLEAWTAKTKSKQVWALTVDWHSPVVVVPQSCVTENATLLALNFGHFNIQYGSNTPMIGYIQDWYKNNPSPRTSLEVSLLESGSISISDLAVVVSTNKTYLAGTDTTSSVMDPISMKFDFGMETVTGRALPRLCLHGELPSYTIRASPLLVSTVLNVANTWTTYLADKPASTNDSAAPEVIEEPVVEETLRSTSRSKPKPTKSPSSTSSPDAAAVQELLSHIFIQTNDCRVVLVDEEQQVEDESKRIKFQAPISKKVADSIVCKGKFELSMTTGVDAKTGKVVSSKMEASGEDMEIFSAVGRSLEYPLQIIDPSKISINVDQVDNATTGQQIDVLMEMLTPMDLIVSTHNMALVNTIASDLSECLAAAPDDLEKADPDKALDEAESKRIQELSNNLESYEAVLASQNGGNENVIVNQNIETQPSEATNKDGSSKKITFKISMAKTTVTIINDLHGFDDALFRVVIGFLMVNGDMTTAEDQDDLLFKLQHSTSIMADYFDPVKYEWKPLLTKPWELTLQMSRVPGNNEQSKRRHTSLDFESLPCHVSFSDQFLINLASTTRIWSLYVSSVSSAIEEMDGDGVDDNNNTKVLIDENQRFVNRAMRNLLVTLPFAVENHSGIETKFMVLGETSKKRICKSGSTEYFRFTPQAGNGVGARRYYGQNLTQKRGVELYFGAEEHRIDAQYLDAGAKQDKQVFELPDGSIVISNISRDVGGATTMLHLSSCIEVYNQTSIPFKISMMDGEVAKDAGTCEPTRVLSSPRATDTLRPLSISNGQVSRPSKGFSIPAPLLSTFAKEWTAQGEGKLSIVISPDFGSQSYEGILHLEPNSELIKANGGTLTARVGIACTSKASEQKFSKFHVQVSVEMSLIDEKYLSLSISLQPRAIIESKVPVAVVVKTPVSLTTSSSTQQSGGEILHELDQGSQVEIFSPETSIAIKINPTKGPVDSDDGGGWFTLPLDTEEHPPEPLTCYFAESGKKSDSISPTDVFFVAEGVRKLDRITSNEGESGASEDIDVQTLANPSLVDIVRTFFVSVRFYAVDHVGDLKFECANTSGSGLNLMKGLRSSKNKDDTQTLQTYDSPVDNKQKITLLPASSIPLRLLKTTENDIQKKSKKFEIEDIAIGEGGIETTPLAWDNSSSSGYYAFRRLLNATQSEIHIVSEFVLFNGSKHKLRIRPQGAKEISVSQGNIIPLQSASEKGCVEFYVDFVGAGCITRLVQVKDLGLKVAIVYSDSGKPLGSVPIQTAIDNRGNSRLVVKVGDLQLGSLGTGDNVNNSLGMFQSDKITATLCLTEFKLTLNKTNKGNTEPVATFMMSSFIGSFKRIFELKPDMQVAETSDVSMAVKSLQLQNETATDPGDKDVLGCSSREVNFLDLFVSINGPFDADLVRVDNFEVNLAHKDKVTKQVVVNASESFIWQLLDVGNRIADAADANEGFMPKFEKSNGDALSYTVVIVPSEGRPVPEYITPRIETLYDLALARVSAFTVVVSFKRNPDASRYQLVEKGRGASMMNYFTRELKFTIDKAALSFAKYEGKGLKGPSNRLIEILSAVYISRMKYKMFTLLSATSLQDWKNLAGREGEDEFVHGDVLRATGNLAGSTADLLFKNVGEGLGGGVSKLTSTLGNGIEKTTSIVGARRIGAGVNSVVSGVGDGVGSTLTGVGTGTGQVLKGVGLGAGQVLGSVGGGVVVIGKDMGKGILAGDGKAIVTDLTRNVGAVGVGVTQGVGVAVNGAAGGVMSAGQGLVSGISSVGKGLTGVFTGKKPTPKSK